MVSYIRSKKVQGGKHMPLEGYGKIVLAFILPVSLILYVTMMWSMIVIKSGKDMKVYLENGGTTLLRIIAFVVMGVTLILLLAIALLFGKAGVGYVSAFLLLFSFPAWKIIQNK